MSFNRSGYIGRAPGDSSVTIARKSYEPTGVQTDFTFSAGYDPGYCDVYLNGIRLVKDNDFTASDGSTVGLTSAAQNGDIVEIVAYKAFNLGQSITDITGDLTITDTLTATNVSGTTSVTAGTFYGNGSGLTGVAATDYIITGTAATFNNQVTVLNLNATGVSTVATALYVGTALTANAAGDVETIGIITAASFSGDGTGLSGVVGVGTLNVRTESLTVSGVSTLTGVTNFSAAVNVDATTDSTSTTTGALIVDGGLGVAKNVYIGAGLSVAGTLTYEDVTSVDSVGLITAKSGVNITGGELTVGSGITMGIAGVATFSGTADIHLTDGVKLLVGDAGSSDASLYHAGGNTYLANATGNLVLGSGGSDTTIKISPVNGEEGIVVTPNTSVDIYYNNSKKFETTNDGTVTTGIATATGGLEINADSKYLKIGASNDIEIWHDGTDSNIRNNTGTLLLRGSSIVLKSNDAGETLATFTDDGSVELRYDNSKKFETTNNGTVTTGISTADGFSVGNGEFYKGFNNSGDSKIIGGYVSGSNTLRLGESLYLDDSGRLLVGNTSSEALVYTGSIQVQGTNSSTSAITVKSNQNDSGGPAIVLGKSRSGSAGGNTVVQSGDQLGSIYFNGADGTDSVSYGAEIRGSVDGTPGSNDMPGRLAFYTTADGAATATERLRITSLATFDFTNGALIEKVSITAGKLSDNTNINLGDGMVHYFTTQESTTCTPNIRVNSSTSLNDIMNLGDVITVTVITTAAAGGYSANWTIDGNAVTEEWVGGSAPSAGGSDGLDIYVLTIICIHASNTGDSGFKVIANLTNAT